MTIVKAKNKDDFYDSDNEFERKIIIDLYKKNLVCDLSNNKLIVKKHTEAFLKKKKRRKPTY